MATVNFSIKTKKNPSSIYVRFISGVNVDIITTSGIHINPNFWDAKNQRIRNVIEVQNRDEINKKLLSLKIAIIDQYNLAFMNGEVIDGQWLKNTIHKFFSRPTTGAGQKILPHTVYLSDFATWWLDNKAPKHKVSASKYMDERTISHYGILRDIIVRFEGKNKIKLRNITAELMDEFSNFLTQKENYAQKTAKRMVGRFKFFCARAEEENIEVNKNYKQRVFVAMENAVYKEPYLNEEEIERIFKHDFSYNDALDNARDNFVIGLRSGLRVSDFLSRLQTDNIQNGFIEIKTKKTGNSVAIPIHPQVKKILKKRNGRLPRKISDQKFNDYIKIIGQIVEIDNEIPGAIVVVDEKTKKKRKEYGIYPKYKLLTSHICRRSFCTNLFGKVPNSVIMATAGWKSEAQMLAYVKKTNLENAKILEKFWEENQT